MRIYFIIWIHNILQNLSYSFIAINIGKEATRKDKNIPNFGKNLLDDQEQIVDSGEINEYWTSINKTEKEFPTLKVNFNEEENKNSLSKTIDEKESIDEN